MARFLTGGVLWQGVERDLRAMVLSYRPTRVNQPPEGFGRYVGVIAVGAVQAVKLIPMNPEMRETTVSKLCIDEFWIAATGADPLAQQTAIECAVVNEWAAYVEQPHVIRDHVGFALCRQGVDPMGAQQVQTVDDQCWVGSASLPLVRRELAALGKKEPEPNTEKR